MVEAPALVQGKKRLDLPDDLAAGAIGIEDLIEEPKEGAPEGEDSLPAVKPLVGLGQQGWRQEAAQELV